MKVTIYNSAVVQYSIKKTKTVSDNTLSTENLGDLFKSFGGKGLIA